MMQPLVKGYEMDRLPQGDAYSQDKYLDIKITLHGDNVVLTTSYSVKNIARRVKKAGRKKEKNLIVHKIPRLHKPLTFQYMKRSADDAIVLRDHAHTLPTT